MRIDPNNPPKFYFIQVQQGGTDLSQETSYLDFQTGSTVTLDAANNRARVNTSYTTLGFTTPVGNSGKVLRSDNTNWVASTFTTVDTFAQGSIPHASTANTITALAIGTAGKMLQSNGTIPTWSTPTWPTASPGAGTFPRGDGTNFVTSTLTLPNASTSGGVLYSSAANTIATSAALGATQVVLGGGAGAAPNTSANLTFNGSTLAVTGYTTTTETATTGSLKNLGTWTGVNGYVQFRDDDRAGFDRTMVVIANSAAVTTLPVFSSLTGAETFARFAFFGDGKLGWGSGAATWDAYIYRVAANQLKIDSDLAGGTAKLGIGVTPTALFHLKAGTTAASTAPLKFTSGTSMTTAEAGAVEFTTDDLFFTITTGAARKAFVLDDGTRLTSGRVPFATTNGRLTDDADLTFATDTLSATKVAMSSLTSGRVPFASTNGLLVDDADFTFATDTLTVTKVSAAFNGSLGATTPSTVVCTNFEANGTMKFGTHSGIAAETLSGYISITDALGNARKLGVIS